MIYKLRRAAMIAMAALMLIGAPVAGTSAYAASGLTPVRDKNPDGTNIFALGDSRLMQMFRPDIYNMPGAASAQGAGHYKGVSKAGYVIDTDANMKSLKSAVKKNIRKKGVAHVFVVATINIDGFGASRVEGPVKAQLEAAKEVCRWSAAYKGKSVKPKVYATSLINRTGVSSAPYNKYLKKLLKKKSWNHNGQIMYLELPNNPGYTDGIHFNDAGNLKVWKVFHRIDGHHYRKYIVDKKATFKANGTMHRVCRCEEECGHKQKKAIPRIGTVKLSKASYVYNGKARKPKVTVKSSTGKSIPKTYYTVTYSNNRNPGRARVTVRFKGRYRGSKSLSFRIKRKLTVDVEDVQIKVGESAEAEASLPIADCVCSDDNVAAVTADGTHLTVTGVQEGTADITITSAGGQSVQLHVTVSAEENEENSETS